MKTAMQELIDFLEPELKMHDFLQLPAYEKAKSLLEKEKQQIVDAINSQWQIGYEVKGEEYYNETYENNL